MRVWTVDAFTNIPFKGNPAAVCMVDEFPTTELCLRIATEMNLSETAFVKRIEKDRFHLRWFTPKVEVKLCGHATLATAHVLHTEGLIQGKKIEFDTLSGPLKVEINQEEYTLDFPLQKVSEKVAVDFGRYREGFKALDDLIIEFDDENEVRKYVPNFAQIESIGCRALIITARGQEEYDFVSRFFAPKIGISEDPVTGSAHCKLAHYWNVKLNKTSFIAYQASARGGEILLSIAGDRVLLKGKAVTILKGELLI